MDGSEVIDRELFEEFLSVVREDDSGSSLNNYVFLHHSMPEIEDTWEACRVDEPVKRANRRRKSKRHSCEAILDQFRNKRNGNPPTKENIRIMMMRAHNRAISLMAKGLPPYGKKLGFLRGQLEYESLWNLMSQIFYEEEMDRMERMQEPVNHSGQYRSFNDEFCRKYFDTEGIRKSYYYFVEFMFAIVDEDVLCKRFLLKCCLDGQHLLCTEKWERLKTFVQVDFLRIIGIDPWEPINN